MLKQLEVQNPFRYRGYYFDSETGLYYLNSRYYDPQTGRFLNADGNCGGGNVFADSRSNAYKLAKAVGGGTPARDPAHGGLGYWRHYHATRRGKRMGGHIFYVA